MYIIFDNRNFMKFINLKEMCSIYRINSIKNEKIYYTDNVFIQDAPLTWKDVSKK